MKKLLLAVPHEHSLDAVYPPVGLLYLAAAARIAGHEVHVVDGQVDGNLKIIQQFDSGNYDYFGTTVLTPLRAASYDLLRAIKKIKPDCITIAGGPHVSILPELTIREVPEIDIVAIGEGEGIIVDILSDKPVSEIPGVCFRDGNQIIKTPRRNPIASYQIPIPAWDLLDIYKYKSFEEVTVNGRSLANDPFLTIYSSRGCQGSCSFCSTWSVWGRWRQVPVSRFVDEVEYLYDRGVKHFFIADDSMINDELFVESMAIELKKRGLDICYKVACRADKITARVVSALKQSGCYEVHIGFESGSQKILDAMGKKLKVSDNLAAARLLRQAGLRIYALVIIGSLNEDIHSVNETVDFLKLISPDVIASMKGLMLLPGTRDFKEAVKRGFINDEYWVGSAPYSYYTANFSSRELDFLYLAIHRRKRVWSRRLLLPQFLLLSTGLFLVAQVKRLLKGLLPYGIWRYLKTTFGSKKYLF